MAKHLVKCKICGEQFDLNSIQGVRCGTTRYAHQSCYPEGELVPMEIKVKKEKKKKEKTKEQEELDILIEYIHQIFGDKMSYARVNKQIKEFKDKYNYSYSGILKSLVWYYEIRGNKVEKANGGIGIVPYIYQAAKDYYYAVFLAQAQNSNKTLKDIIPNTYTIEIDAPQRKEQKVKFFDLT